MKNNPFRSKPTRSHMADDSSIALIITLAIMSLLLVLVLSFATVTRMEIQTATSNRDLVASKYLAQAALQRAIADLSSQYLASPGSTNTGVSSCWSEIGPTTNTITTWVGSLANTFSTNFITDIETVTLDPITGNVVTSPGPDDRIDYVVLPNGGIAFTPGVQPQWIGMKDTNGQLLGRIAFLANGASLCINAIGNLDAHTNFAGLTMNTRNEGIHAPEINLVTALMGIRWTKNDAVSDATEILRYRYGSVDPTVASGLDYPGTAGVDDDANDAVNATKGLDNDGNGRIDAAGDGIDEAQEYLSTSDQTNATAISAIGDDRVFTDLKQLVNVASFSAGMKARFQSNFALVQQTFVTQSPAKLDPNYINLNGGTYPSSTNDFFTALTNRFATIDYPNSNLAYQVQMAANIASYRDTNLSGVHRAPVMSMVNGTNILGVAPVPHLNELTYVIVLDITKTLGSGSTNITITTANSRVIAELWYPYTNGAFPSSVANTTVEYALRQEVEIASLPFTALPVTTPSTVVPNFSMPQATVATCTNSTQFRTFTNTFNLGSYPSTAIGTEVNVGFTNFSFFAQFKQQAGSPAPLYDEWPAFAGLNRLATGVAFSYVEITNAVPGGVNPGSVSRSLTSVVSVALNDPRVKSSWKVQYVGNVTNAAGLFTPGARNASGTNMFYPTSTNADDWRVSIPIAGIATNTFYIPNKGYFISAAELGRVHRGQPWMTVDLTGTSTNSSIDRVLLDHFTTWNPGSNNYVQGRINLNTPASQFGVWAGLFGGMPLWDGATYVDYNATGALTPMTKTSNLATVITSVKYSSPSSLASLEQFANMQSNYPSSSWPAQTSDVDREWILNHILNLTTTRGSGNFFTVWAWGQTLKGSTADATKKRVGAETLIVAMVKIEPALGTNNANMRIVYFRYNPDLDFTDIQH